MAQPDLKRWRKGPKKRENAKNARSIISYRPVIPVRK